jgi:hypothetical protein
VDKSRLVALPDTPVEVISTVPGATPFTAVAEYDPLAG